MCHIKAQFRNNVQPGWFWNSFSQSMKKSLDLNKLACVKTKSVGLQGGRMALPG